MTKQHTRTTIFESACNFRSYEKCWREIERSAYRNMDCMIDVINSRIAKAQHTYSYYASDKESVRFVFIVVVKSVVSAFTHFHNARFINVIFYRMDEHTHATTTTTKKETVQRQSSYCRIMEYEMASNKWYVNSRLYVLNMVLCVVLVP